MARCLDRFSEWSADTWAKRLSEKKTVWLNDKPFKQAGGRGRRPAHWQPVLLIDAIIHQRILKDDHAKAAKRARRLFETRQPLKAWLGEWDAHADKYYPEE